MHFKLLYPYVLDNHESRGGTWVLWKPYLAVEGYYGMLLNNHSTMHVLVHLIIWSLICYITTNPLYSVPTSNNNALGSWFLLLIFSCIITLCFYTSPQIWGFCHFTTTEQHWPWSLNNLIEFKIYLLLTFLFITLF